MAVRHNTFLPLAGRLAISALALGARATPTAAVPTPPATVLPPTAVPSPPATTTVP